MESGAPDSASPAVRDVVVLFCSLAAVMLLASLNQTVFAPALPSIVADLDGLDAMPWVIAAFLLGSVVTMPLYGKVSDVFGRRPLLLVAIGLFTAGSAVGALAPGMAWLIAGRALQGLGAGGLVILSQAAIADVVPARERGRYQGIMSSVFAVASIAGPLVGGWLVEGPGWRWTFWMNVPLGVLAAAAVVLLLRLPRPARPPDARVDVAGTLLLAVATTAVALFTVWGGSAYAWGSPQILALIATAVAAAAALVLVERRVRDPLLPPWLFRERNFVLPTFAALCLGVAMFGVVGYLPTFLQLSLGYGAAEAGALMIPMAACMLVGSIVSGQIVARTGAYRWFPICGGLLVALGLLLLSTLRPGVPAALICVYEGLIGVGIGFSLGLLVLIVQNAFPHAVVGTATGATSLFRQIGGMLGIAVVGSVFTTRVAMLLAERGERDAVADVYGDALAPVYAVLALLGVAASVASWFVRRAPLAETVGGR
ncbi:MDR family MFS transporter [Microbacterium sp. No. 7]|uniref:MDR family MFS transporter n=1 Tax=Microbacterium sp. No. 7 TaxID=1714373 RepID=UPI0006D2243B|nr:MDR family MFS transporter [Microbacterium sp. No. 7]ALJ21939.1 MFS transporter [Microbacterium sp. No. 7]